MSQAGNAEAVQTKEGEEVSLHKDQAWALGQKGLSQG